MTVIRYYPTCFIDVTICNDVDEFATVVWHLVRQLQDSWMTIEWQLNDSWITIEWQLNVSWLTVEWQLNNSWMTVEWQLTFSYLHHQCTGKRWYSSFGYLRMMKQSLSIQKRSRKTWRWVPYAYQHTEWLTWYSDLNAWPLEMRGKMFHNSHLNSNIKVLLWLVNRHQHQNCAKFWMWNQTINIMDAVIKFSM